MEKYQAPVLNLLLLADDTDIIGQSGDPNTPAPANEQRSLVENGDPVAPF